MVEPDRILIVRPSALGDVCRSVPVLATLRRAFPGATIDWVVQAEFVPAIAAHPALDEAVGFPRERFARWWHSPAVGREMAGWFTGLRRRRYDLVFDFQGLGRSGLITWATGAPRRVGHRGARELAWLGYTVRHPSPPRAHTVRRMMSLLEAEGLEPTYDMRLYVSEADKNWWRARHSRLISGREYVVVAPTSRWPSKRWPQPSWSSLIGPLIERGFGAVVMVGSPAERPQVDAIARGRDAGDLIDLVGATTVGQTMAVVAAAGLVIANDSAPLHMAVGFDRRCIGLYGPTDPELVGPFSVPDAVIGARRRPARVNYKDLLAGDDLIASIRPAEVLGRVDRMLAGGGP